MQNSRQIFIFALTLLSLSCVPVLFLSCKSTEAKNSSIPVLVELFTSEGCSSCPPADAVLMKLRDEQPVSGVQIITLSESVTYWDYLGWRDPHGSDSFNDRQKAYVQSFRLPSMYTPQMVVDGKTQFNGSNFGEAISAIATAAKVNKASLTASAEIQNDVLKIDAELQSLNSKIKDDGTLNLALVEDNLVTQVKGGENSGRRLPHNSVVREIFVLGDVSTASSGRIHKTVMLNKALSQKHIRAVAFVQSKKSKIIVGACECAVTKH